MTNYIVAVWMEEALEACAVLNLPCADIRPLVRARKLPEELWRGQFVTWTRHIVAERVLEKGLVMHFMGEARLSCCGASQLGRKCCIGITSEMVASSLAKAPTGCLHLDMLLVHTTDGHRLRESLLPGPLSCPLGPPPLPLLTAVVPPLRGALDHHLQPDEGVHAPCDMAVTHMLLLLHLVGLARLTGRHPPPHRPPPPPPPPSQTWTWLMPPSPCGAAT